MNRVVVFAEGKVNLGLSNNKHAEAIDEVSEFESNISQSNRNSDVREEADIQSINVPLVANNSEKKLKIEIPQFVEEKQECTSQKTQSSKSVLETEKKKMPIKELNERILKLHKQNMLKQTQIDKIAEEIILLLRSMRELYPNKPLDEKLLIRIAELAKHHMSGSNQAKVLKIVLHEFQRAQEASSLNVDLVTKDKYTLKYNELKKLTEKYSEVSIDLDEEL